MAVVDAHAVILNWNRAQDTLECLDSLVAQEDALVCCIVVDNGSTDDSVTRIRARYPNIHLVQIPKNIGYPGGINAGIRYALDQGAQKILLLNNDTVAHPRMVHSLLADWSADLGITAPAIFYAAQPQVVWSVGGHIHPLLLEMTRPHGGGALPAAPLERDFVTGCAMMVRADVIEKVGLMDERYFPGYYEDLDFCLRLRRAGYRIRLVPQAHLWHKVSQSSGGENAPRVLYLMARNSGYYFRKNMSLWQAPFVVGYRLLSALKTTLRLSVRKDWPGLAAYWRGLVHGWTGLISSSGAHYLSHYDSGQPVDKK